jgi:hypothetical protein
MLDVTRHMGAPLTRESWQAGYAARREWADGSHDLVGFRWTEASAAKFVDRDRWYWRRGPVRPQSWELVLVSRRDFDLHAGRDGCRSPGCPTASDTASRHPVEP